MQSDVPSNLEDDGIQHRVPTRAADFVFALKSRGLQARRAALDTAQHIQCYPCGEIKDFPIILAASRTPLWTEDNEAEMRLQAGKTQNLRCALRRLNGALIPAQGIFSFWKQIGQATRRRGYVAGRLLREGCLIPSVGGGLCQLSNALYDVALQADCLIIERYAHSHIVPGSAAVAGRDATVAWNYIDLRFQPRQPILIEARLTADELVIRLRGQHDPTSQPQSTPLSIIHLPLTAKPQPAINVQAHSCATCGTASCFRHQPQAPVALAPRSHIHQPKRSLPATFGRTAYLVDECWPEFQAYLAQAWQQDDILGIPLDGQRWHQPRYAWNAAPYAEVYTATGPTLIRAARARRHQSGGARLQAQLDGAQAVAMRLGRQLPPDAIKVCVAQSLLPFLWRAGFLGGRSFDVLMTRLPLQVLQRRLDEALAQHPERQTLGEYRAPQWLVETEAEALQAAQQVITPHSAVAALFPAKVRRLAWHQPGVPNRVETNRTHSQSVQQPPRLAFAGPTVARKGAYEVRAVARALGLEVMVWGSDLEAPDFWQGVRTCGP